MEFLSNYGLFLAKCVTVVIAFIIMVATVASVSGRGRGESAHKGNIKVDRLNDEFDEMKETIKDAVLDKELLKQERKAEKKSKKQEAKERKKQLKEAEQASAAVSQSTEHGKSEAEGADSAQSEAVEPEQAVALSQENNYQESKNHENKSEEQKEEQKEQKEQKEDKPRVYLLKFHGDKHAHGVEDLAKEITAVLTLAREEDEVVLQLESGGGLVHSYGLAGSQLQRIKDAKIPLTICVDLVAASGGYLMACVADKILAAPFAIVGSVGVVAEVPNLNRLLKKHDVDIEQHTAGKYKRTITLLGENTDEGRAKFLEELEDTHDLFKDFVRDARPQLDVEAIATGEHWYGKRALDLKLVDELKTSDDYLYERSHDSEVYHVHYERKQRLADRLQIGLAETASTVFRKAISVLYEKRYL